MGFFERVWLFFGILIAGWNEARSLTRAVKRDRDKKLYEVLLPLFQVCADDGVPIPGYTLMFKIFDREGDHRPIACRHRSSGRSGRDRSFWSNATIIAADGSIEDAFLFKAYDSSELQLILVRRWPWGGVVTHHALPLQAQPSAP